MYQSLNLKLKKKIESKNERRERENRRLIHRDRETLIHSCSPNGYVHKLPTWANVCSLDP